VPTRTDDLLATQRFSEFTRAEWAALRDATPLPLSEPQLNRLAGVNEPMSIDEVVAVYLPLARLLNLRIEARRRCGGDGDVPGTELPPRRS
jgi:type I pantothenate kinase